MKAVKLFLKRFKNSKIISKYDQLADVSINYENNDMLHGWHSSTIDELLEAPGLTKAMCVSKMRQKPSEKEKIHLSWDVPNFVCDAVLNSNSLAQKVIDYIGPGARLDDIYIKNITDGLESASEGWHDDNVGYRLKLFMVFDTEGIPSGTILIPKARPNLYEVNVIDEISRIIGKPRKEPRGSQLIINYNAGDCLLFDTNLPHRGDYTTNVGTRYCVIAEFIDRNKADKLKGKAPCGPGQGRMKIYIPEHLKDNRLIDNNLYYNEQYGY